MTFPASTNVDGSNPGPNSSTLPNPYLNQGGPNQFGDSATSLNAFYGATPVAQRSSSVQTSSNLASSTDFGATQLAWAQEVTATLVGLGLWKGS